jgi:hypothetical protein
MIANSAVAGIDYLRPIAAQMASRPRLPSQVAIAGDIFERFILAQPIVLNFEQGDRGKIIASDDIFYMYGEGNTRQEAVRDYLATLSEYYSLLQSQDDAPSVELFSYLQTYLHPK